MLAARRLLCELDESESESLELPELSESSESSESESVSNADMIREGPAQASSAPVVSIILVDFKTPRAKSILAYSFAAVVLPVFIVSYT